jgi:hypothetical protein
VEHPISSLGGLPYRANARSQAADPTRPLFIVFTVLVLARICIANNLLDMMMSYSSEGGNLLEKIHPASWLMLLLAGLVAPRIASLSAPDDRNILHAMVIMMGLLCCAALVPMIGSASSSLGVGYLVDSLLVAAVTACVLLLLPLHHRRKVGQIIITVLVLNSVLALWEFAFKQHFIPSIYEEWIFRSRGILTHPLSLGLSNAAAICFVFLTDWSAARKFVSIILLIAGTLAAGARTASIASVIAPLVAFFMIGGPPSEAAVRGQIKVLVLLAVVFTSPLAWIVVNLTGLNDRFEMLGLVDASAQTRVVILQVFDFISWRDLIFGAGLQTLNRIALSTLRLPTVENSIVVFIFQFGLVGTACLVSGFLYALYTLARGTSIEVKMALLTFLVVGLSANTFSTKGSEIMMTFVLAVAFRVPGPSRPTWRPHRAMPHPGASPRVGSTIIP